MPGSKRAGFSFGAGCFYQTARGQGGRLLAVVWRQPHFGAATSSTAGSPATAGWSPSLGPAKRFGRAHAEGIQGPHGAGGQLLRDGAEEPSRPRRGKDGLRPVLSRLGGLRSGSQRHQDGRKSGQGGSVLLPVGGRVRGERPIFSVILRARFCKSFYKITIVMKISKNPNIQ